MRWYRLYRSYVPPPRDLLILLFGWSLFFWCLTVRMSSTCSSVYFFLRIEPQFGFSLSLHCCYSAFLRLLLDNRSSLDQRVRFILLASSLLRICIPWWSILEISIKPSEDFRRVSCQVIVTRTVFSIFWSFLLWLIWLRSVKSVSSEADLVTLVTKTGQERFWIQMSDSSINVMKYFLYPPHWVVLLTDIFLSGLITDCIQKSFRTFQWHPFCIQKTKRDKISPFLALDACVRNYHFHFRVQSVGQIQCSLLGSSSGYAHPRTWH